VASKTRKWHITKIANSARKNIENLELKSQKEIIRQFEALQYNLFRRDIKKVTGKKNIYRGRIGDIRYYFRLFFKSKSIEILLLETRSHVKKKTIQRLK